MEKIDLNTFLQDRKNYIEKARQGSVFFYPTDTIYGLGGIVCDTVIDRINQIKQRPEGKFYSVIAPSFAWIEEHCAVDDAERVRISLLDRYPGGLTVLLPLRTGDPLRKRYDTGTLGVRMLAHPMQAFVAQLGEPFMTTSANVSGGVPVRCFADLLEQQKTMIDCVIDAGIINGAPSTVYDWKTSEKVRG